MCCTFGGFPSQAHRDDPWHISSVSSRPSKAPLPLVHWWFLAASHHNTSSNAYLYIDYFNGVPCLPFAEASRYISHFRPVALWNPDHVQTWSQGWWGPCKSQSDSLAQDPLYRSRECKYNRTGGFPRSFHPVTLEPESGGQSPVSEKLWKIGGASTWKK